MRPARSATFVRPPPTAPGMTIGLFGGTFDPPHAAHVHASETALRRLGLDRVWWLVSPGNVLKDTRGLTPLSERMAQARKLLRDPRIIVTDIEAKIGTRFTFDTLDWLTSRCPDVHFVWIMGTDILAQFHRWQNWRDIADMIPFAVIDRPGSGLAATASPAAQALAQWRLPEQDSSLLAHAQPPAWTILHGKRLDLSSTMLRKNRAAPPTPSNVASLLEKSLPRG